jgi:hypothetical protein
MYEDDYFSLLPQEKEAVGIHFAVAVSAGEKLSEKDDLRSTTKWPSIDAQGGCNGV